MLTKRKPVVRPKKKAKSSHPFITAADVMRMEMIEPTMDLGNDSEDIGANGRNGSKRSV